MPFENNEYIRLSEDLSVPCHYSNGKLAVYMGGRMCEIDGEKDYLIANNPNTITETQSYYHLVFPIKEYFSKIIMGSNEKITQSALAFGTYLFLSDYYIINYKYGAKYSKMVFNFPELDFFIPSVSSSRFESGNPNIVFSREKNILYSQSISHSDQVVLFSLYTYSKATSNSKCEAETVSELSLEFDETDDYSFIFSLFNLVKNLFSFIANRTNISVVDAKLHGHNNNSNLKSTFHIALSSHMELEDSPKKMREIVMLKWMNTHFGDLIQIISDGKVNIISLHDSKRSMNQFDIKQCLGITSSFEYYQRSFLPPISSKSSIEVCDEIKQMIENYAQQQSGKKRKKALGIAKSITPDLPLCEKIRKTYKGYKSDTGTEWTGLEDILGEWFNDIDSLADVANNWRNELAHCKREYAPDENVIYAMRLIEHINYVIVLRNAMYEDREIKNILYFVFNHI